MTTAPISVMASWLTFRPVVSMSKATYEMRQDKAEVKRVELHAHTTFSNMDALSSLSPKAPGLRRSETGP